MEIGGLAADTTYYFGVKAIDDAGLSSRLGRIAEMSTFTQETVLRSASLNELLGGLDRRGHAPQLQLAEYEWFEQFQGHLLRQTALVQSERRTNHDHTTGRVVDTFAEQVLVLRRIDLYDDAAVLVAQDHVGRVVDVPAQGVQCPGVLAGPIAHVATADAAQAITYPRPVGDRQRGIGHLHQV